MKTKAQLGFLQWLILFLFAAAILFYVFGVIFADQVNKKQSIEACRQSAMIIDTHRKNNPVNKEPLMDLRCKMREIKVSAGDVKIDGEINRNKVMSYISEEMRTCWHMMGDGRFKPFKQNIVVSSTNPCIICSHISFGEKIQEKMPEIQGFNRFLNRTMKDSKISYKDYLDIDYEGEWGVVWYSSSENSLKSQDIIDTTKDYFVIYNVYLPNSIDSEENRVLPFGTPERSYIYMTSAQDIYDAGCDYIANELR